MKRSLPVIAILLLLSAGLYAQDISGYWQGVSYQDFGGPVTYYPASIQIVQNGTAITGTLTEKMPGGSPSYCIYGLKGTVNNNIFTFEITGILEQVPPPAPYIWCTSGQGTLTYDATQQKMKGPTNSTDCGITGSIEMWRLQVNGNTVFCEGRPVQLSVTGKDVKWYGNSSLSNRVHTGNNYAPVITTSTTFYVTQTHYNTESPAIPVAVTIKPKALFTIDTAICRGQSFMAHDKSGTYTDTFAASNGCDSIRMIRLEVLEKPAPRSVQTELCKGDTLLLDPGSYSSYLWQDGSTQSLFAVDQPGVYSVNVTNICGSAKMETTVTGQSCDLYFPNAFTPNNDGKNDLFRILNAHGIEQYGLSVYNRWGQKIFQTSNHTTGWHGYFNGQPQPSGLYIWYCTLKRKNKVITRKGSVLLIR